MKFYCRNSPSPQFSAQADVSSWENPYLKSPLGQYSCAYELPSCHSSRLQKTVAFVWGAGMAAFLFLRLKLSTWVCLIAEINSCYPGLVGEVWVTLLFDEIRFDYLACLSFACSWLLLDHHLHNWCARSYSLGWSISSQSSIHFCSPPTR